MIGLINESNLFLHYSPKRKKFLEHLVKACFPESLHLDTLD